MTEDPSNFTFLRFFACKIELCIADLIYFCSDVPKIKQK